MGGIEVKSRPNRSASSRSLEPRRQACPSLTTSTTPTTSHSRWPGGSRPRRQDQDCPSPPSAAQCQHRLPAPQPAIAVTTAHHGADGGTERPGRRPTWPSDGTVTILFCDMVDYAGMTERLGDQASRRLLHEQHRIVREALAAPRRPRDQRPGRRVHGRLRRGRPRPALRHRHPAVPRAYVPPKRARTIAVHIGIHTGDALAEGDDYLGHTVIVASRLADAAGPGEILVSSLSEQLVQGSGEFAFDGHRETRLKGMARAQLVGDTHLGAVTRWTRGPTRRLGAGGALRPGRPQTRPNASPSSST